MSEQYDAIIIGAGIGGLTAGTILAKNGMKVLILEKNHVPGGAVTTFYREGYPIDIPHAFCAVKKGAFMHSLFGYLGILDKLDFIELEKAFVYFSNSLHKPILCFTDLRKYRQELSSHFPQEKANIRRFLGEATHIWKDEILKSYYDPSIIRLLSYPLLFDHLFRFKGHTFDRYLSRFTKNEDLKSAISAGWPYLGLERNFVSALYMICLLNTYHKDKSYFVRGGIGRTGKVLADKFTEEGGKIEYSKKISQILLNSHKSAYGVRDVDNNVYTARIIISNCDSKRAFDLVDQNCLPRRFMRRVHGFKMSCSAIQAHIVIEGDVDSDLLSTGSVIIPFRIDLEKRIKNLLRINDASSGNPELVLSIHPFKLFELDKPGSFIINVLWFSPNFHLWKKLFNLYGGEVYGEIKKEITTDILEAIKGICSVKKVNFMHVLTPLSLEKWLNSTSGAIYDIESSPRQSLLNRMKYHTPIKNMFLVGAKTFPGAGMAGAFTSGLSLADFLLGKKITKGRLRL